MTAHVFHQNALKEVSSGPSVYAYSSTAPASAPWVRVTEIQVRNSGLWKPAWTLSDPLTLTFDATAVRSFQCQQTSSQYGDNFTPTYVNPSSSGYNVSTYKLFDDATFWKSTSDVGGTTAACGHPSSGSRFTAAFVGVIGNFVNTQNTSETMSSALTNALQTRGVIKSVTIAMRRKYDDSNDLGVSNSISGTLHTVLYPYAVSSSSPRYEKLNTTTTYRGSGTFSGFSNNETATFTVNVNTLQSIINNPTHSIALVTSIKEPNQYMTQNGTPDPDRCEMRGPSSSGVIGISRPTITVVLDYT